MKANDLSQSNLQRTVLLILGTAVITILATVGVLYASGLLASANRQANVAARGAQVMPFDLAQTTHVFQPQAMGGIQKVIAKDPANSTQIGLIRTHLQAEAAKFQAGDFADPSSIHGDTMPGLATLKTDFRNIDVRYEALPNGAQILYTTSNPALITAIHEWFAAQGTDHGHDAMMQ